MDKKTHKILMADLEGVLRRHPGLVLKCKKDIPFEIYGIYDIRDDDGVLQGEFDIRVFIPSAYPYSFPAIMEKSKKIDRAIDRHINQAGAICEEIDQKENIIASKGISITQYFEQYVHKYFCWQLVYEEEGNKNLKEYAHHEEGIIQFYKEFLKIENNVTVKECLEAVALNTLPGRNDPCLCGSNKKMKFCHLEIFNDLKRIGREQLNKDLKMIGKLQML
jgi:hypothetical protein